MSDDPIRPPGPPGGFDPDFLQRLEALRASGVEPYPNGLRVTHSTGEVRATWGHLEANARLDDTDVSVGGRVMFRNHMGKAVFLRLQDRAGRLQVYARREEVGDETFAMLKALEVGDILWARGIVMTTRTGELSVQCREARLAAKIGLPLPISERKVVDGHAEWGGLTDPELRYRQRYVDLFLHEETRETFRRRSAIVTWLRKFFLDRDYVEVETPMMQAIPGGANARPFVTHHNALDIDMYLRVAPELFLKRLVVGGLERVFEINKNFRNEGLSHRHNPEFTMLEWYQAWATWEDLVAMSEEMLGGLVLAVCGSHRVKFGETEVDWAPPYRKAAMDELVAEATGLSRQELRDPAAIRRWYCERHGEREALPTTMGRWWERLFEEYVEQTIVNPTFVTGYPTEISPLSRRNDADPSVVDRFELFVVGREIGNGFSELNDPVDQASRFAEQVAARDQGDEEGMHFDHDYIRALTYGMPPTAGQGIGIDRLVMLLTDRQSIRDVILFPTMRPESPLPPGGLRPSSKR